MIPIIPHLKRILKTIREQIVLHAYDCDGMYKHCPDCMKTKDTEISNLQAEIERLTIEIENKK